MLTGDDMEKAISDAVSAMNIVSAQCTTRSQSGPTMAGVFTEMDAVKDAMVQDDQQKQTAIGGLKKQIYEDLPAQARDELLPGLEEFMRELIAEQVNKTVNASIGEYIAVPLEEQKQVAERMARKIDVELDNSKARLENSRMHPDDTDAFKHVLRKDGSESKMWPYDFRSLFAFEDKDLDELLKDFDLSIGAGKDEKGVKFQEDIKRMKMQAFLAHIGAPVDVLHFV